MRLLLPHLDWQRPAYGIKELNTTLISSALLRISMLRVLTFRNYSTTRLHMPPNWWALIWQTSFSNSTCMTHSQYVHVHCTWSDTLCYRMLEILQLWRILYSGTGAQRREGMSTPSNCCFYNSSNWNCTYHWAHDWCRFPQEQKWLIRITMKVITVGVPNNDRSADCSIGIGG